MITKPFPHLEIKNFLKKKEIDKLLQKVKKQRFHLKKSDLFQFSQTDDLLKNKDFKEIISYLTSKEYITYMEKTTGIKLNGKIDLFASLYQDTDFLLPHDDRLSGRKIAFMIYLSDLKKKDGGALLLYDKSNNAKEVKIIEPKFNSFVFFEVSSQSLHGVEEVVSNKKRYALSGWFHGN